MIENMEERAMRRHQLKQDRLQRQAAKKKAEEVVTDVSV